MVIQNHRCAGYILLLMLLAVILLGMFFSYKAWRGHGVNVDSGEELKNPPWRQWYNIQKHLARGDLGKPTSQQPKITEIMSIEAPLLEKQDERGMIILRFDPDYTIEGAWDGTFFADPNRSREFQLVECKIKGYLVPDETCLDVEKRNDPAKIYFLSKGFFILIDYDRQNRKTLKLTGDIYVSGWLLPDLSIQQGQAVMTSDKEHFRSFDFSGRAKKGGMESMESFLKALQQK